MQDNEKQRFTKDVISNAKHEKPHFECEDRHFAKRRNHLAPATGRVLADRDPRQSAFARRASVELVLSEIEPVLSEVEVSAL